MPKKNESTAVTPIVIDSRVHAVRGVRVMLDSDLAEFYGVPTKELTQAVKRNAGRFPEDFAFQLTGEEFDALRSQIVTSNEGCGGRRYRPWVFTEHGVAMLSGLLRSETAARITVEVMRAFVRVRCLLDTPGEVLTAIQQLTDVINAHDEQIRAISAVLRKMTVAPPTRSQRPVGLRQLHPTPATPQE